MTENDDKLAKKLAEHPLAAVGLIALPIAAAAGAALIGPIAMGGALLATVVAPQVVWSKIKKIREQTNQREERQTPLIENKGHD